MLPPHARTFSNLRLLDVKKQKPHFPFYGFKPTPTAFKLLFMDFYFCNAEEYYKKPSIIANGLIKVHVER
tara:strand:+ start:1279 stop:1488 length:210 start_codon:yes stop_codon:yes gene_type:complete